MRKSIRVTAVVSALLVLSACGTRIQGGQSSDASSGPNAKPLVYWGKWAKGTPQATLFESIIADYAKQTGVKVDVQWLGKAQEEQIKNAIATGEGPDFFDTAIDHTAEFRAAGALGDMSAVFKAKIPGENATIEEVLPKSVLKAISDDKGYGFVPHSVFSVGLWYDAARYPDFATTPPKTFEDFLAVAGKEKAAGRRPIALDGTVNSYNAFWLYQLLLSTAGPGALRQLAEDPAAWDRPEVKRAVTALETLVKAGLFQPDYMATKFPDAQNAWAAGDHTFNLNGTWLGSETASLRTPAVKARIIALPPVDASKGSAVTIGALGWGVNPKSKSQQAVTSFLAFAMQKKYIDRIATDADNIPSRTDSPAPEALTSIQESIRTATAVSLDFDGVATVAPKWFNDVFLPLDDKLVGGSIDAGKFLAEGKAQTAELGE
ncbi:ABC transporter substrate-binding protein [Nonomuraea pusilla]|uniref:Raffinose/stachyose/melibiose transport system substrate-binding protein n=1 Tax=Nonomuraea pusilla TaxID=46177 RepID=A0A1H8IE05_9ACTN|nr:ABC transporter substrate-binding protein [Nonomuraea pusilla]SEN66531.1 raffinose/stachyose/melibiose transport system substrate-binding protein [Nonomuraea pusilla]